MKEQKVIPFSRPTQAGHEERYLRETLQNNLFSGDHTFTQKCHSWFEEKTGTQKVLMTTSCTHALEMVAILLNFKAGDEVIMPSFTFPSTANAFALRGANIVFVDIRPDTMNIDEAIIEKAITSNTRAIVPMHYAGVACEMDTIMDIAKRHYLFVVEDAAQCMIGKYKGKYLGTFGEFGCYSFHETKNYQCGEGGALLINKEKYIHKAEIIREKGTNRAQFFRGEIDKYTWLDMGSSYLPGELNMAFLYAQLEKAEEIHENRMNTWNLYYQRLRHLEEGNYIELPFVPAECEHNGHIFYIKVKDHFEQIRMLNYLNDNNVSAFFHYIPLHSSLAGRKWGRFFSEDRFTTKESERLIRLPIYYRMDESDVNRVCDLIEEYYTKNRLITSAIGHVDEKMTNMEHGGL